MVMNVVQPTAFKVGVIKPFSVVKLRIFFFPHIDLQDVAQFSYINTELDKYTLLLLVT